MRREIYLRAASTSSTIIEPSPPQGAFPECERERWWGGGDLEFGSGDGGEERRVSGGGRRLVAEAMGVVQTAIPFPMRSLPLRSSKI